MRRLFTQRPSPLRYSSQTTNGTFTLRLHNTDESETVPTGRTFDISAVLSETRAILDRTQSTVGANFSIRHDVSLATSASVHEDAEPSGRDDEFDRSFDVSNEINQEEPINESDIPDPSLSETVLDDSPVRYEIVEAGTNRGAQKLVSTDGYSYTLKKKTSKTTTWRCSIRNKSHSCRATVLEKGGEFIRGVMAHEHPADPGITKKTKVKAKVTTEARVHAYKSAGNIVEDAFTEMIEPTDFNLPKQANLERMANRVRQKLRPAEPTDLSFEIDTEFLGCDDFLIGDIRVGEERHIMFATEAQLRVLQRAKRWYLDGTFKVIRDPFVQLFSVHAFVQKQDCLKQVPLAFVMMSKRRKIDYVAVFRKLNETIGDGVAVQGFVMDFEPAAWEAVKEVYPDCDIRGCVFHWGQAVMRKVANLGLKTTYQERQGLHVFIRKVLALPFLPSSHIEGAFDQMVQDARTPELQQLMGYLDTTWMNNPHWSHRQWSVYQQSVRTNNDVEGWHRRLNGKAGRSLLHFYLLVPLLRKEARCVDIQVQLVDEQAVSRQQRNAYKHLHGRLQELWEKYERKQLKTSEFLREVGHIYAPYD